MALGQGIYPWYYYPPTPVASDNGKDEEKEKQENVFAKEQERIDSEAKKAQEEFLARLNLIKLRAEHEAETKTLNKMEEDAERAYRVFEKSKNNKAEGRLDSGQGGIMRWLSNAGTSLLNLGKSIIGFDKDGKWNPKKCLTNVVITAAAIGATFIPYVGPVIGYGLLATGVIGGAVGVAKGMKALDEAEKIGDQSKIDAAQQDICSNAFIGITSIFGLRGIGSSFRTSTATAELASSAASRSSTAGRVVETMSNFGRDITVNAYRSTKHSCLTGSVPHLTRFKGWDKQYRYQSRELYRNLNQKLADLDAQILAETNPAKQALLQEQKLMLESNLAEFNQIGRSIKTKADFEKLSSDNMAQFNEEYVQNIFPESEGIVGADGNITLFRNINGTLLNEQEVLAFQKMAIRQQRAIDKELKLLVKAKENMMRTFERHAKKHKAELEQYVADEKIGGVNPSPTKGWLRYLLTSPESTVPKIMGQWVDPIHSGAAIFTVDLSKEDTQVQLDAMQQAIDSIKSVKEKMEKASTIDEYNIALADYNKLILAANGQTEDVPGNDASTNNAE